MLTVAPRNAALERYDCPLFRQKMLHRTSLK